MQTYHLMLVPLKNRKVMLCKSPCMASTQKSEDWRIEGDQSKSVQMLVEESRLHVWSHGKWRLV